MVDVWNWRIEMFINDRWWTRSEQFRSKSEISTRELSEWVCWPSPILAVENFLLEGLQAFCMGEGRVHVYRECVPLHHNREREGPSGVVRCVATWKLELGCMPGSDATGWPVVRDGCDWWWNHGLELRRSCGAVKLLQVRQCSHSPANPQALEQDPRAKDVQGTSLDTV